MSAGSSATCQTSMGNTQR